MDSLKEKMCLLQICFFSGKLKPVPFKNAYLDGQKPLTDTAKLVILIWRSLQLICLDFLCLLSTSLRTSVVYNIIIVQQVQITSSVACKYILFLSLQGFICNKTLEEPTTSCLKPDAFEVSSSPRKRRGGDTRFHVKLEIEINSFSEKKEREKFISLSAENGERVFLIFASLQRPKIISGAQFVKIFFLPSLFREKQYSAAFHSGFSILIKVRKKILLKVKKKCIFSQYVSIIYLKRHE